MSEPATWSEEAERTTSGVIVPPQTAPSVPPPGSEQVVVASGGPVGASQTIGDRCRIGRAPGCEVVLRDTAVSREHAVIVRQADGSLVIEDLASRNGTWLNGRRVQRAVLSTGDRVQLGPRAMLSISVPDPVHERRLARQRMEAVGRLATRVAHDYNNLMGAALATSEHLALELERVGALRHGEVGECMRDLRLVLERARELTHAIGSQGRREAARRPAPVDVGEVCDEVLRLCRRTFGGDIQVRRRWHAGHVVRAHRTELHQIVLNLCLNARDAMPEGGTLRIAVEAARGALGDGTEGVLVRVADTGAGMSESVRRRVFEPFFTTKADGRGSGLGLATVKELAEGMGGRVEVESEPGRGSVFRVWLPACSERAAPRPERVEARRTSAALPRAVTEEQAAVREERRTSPRESGTLPKEAAPILVVDDQVLVQRCLARLLTGAGHRVETASDGREALARVKASRPAAVLLDLDLPVMRGDAVLEALLELDPTLPVITMSGHFGPDREAALRRAGARGHLAKPFDAGSLRALLAELDVQPVARAR
ncbi:MAG: response regulator [Sandaracinaceae bacterium]|nr:response regulator [Sandaracinaceae bacterium]